MKNLYLLPKDKQSRLVKIKDTFFLTTSDDIPGGTFYNIHITTDEEIGEGDWYLDTTVNVIFKNDKLFLNGTGYKKIILSTDPELIADGIQAIDDEFLLWFVKNNSCEFVVIDWSPLSKNLYGWKIIIPQEEPKGEKKPHSFCETPEEKCTMNYCDDNGCQNRKRHLIDPYEQETLEEAAEKYAEGKSSSSVFQEAHKKDFIKGAKWQAERMYSEEDLVELLNFVSKEYNISNGIGWFHTHESIEDVSSKEVLDKFFEKRKKK